MSGGVEFVANYTLAKASDGGQVPGQFGTFNGTDSPVDPFNRKLEYALSDLNQRNRLVANVVWVPPYARNLSSSWSAFSWVMSPSRSSFTSTHGAPSHNPRHSANSSVTFPSLLVPPGRTSRR